ncbi:MAG: DUF2808 domain-containing protein [Gemmatimonadaceae bacterium]|nr:DUF2808 domain-containing protein [Gloeobacterales cyanobacterium ES-bin-141]
MPKIGLPCLLTVALYFAIAVTPVHCPVYAGQLPSGETFFERSPFLTRASTNNNSAAYNIARYSFEVRVPADSGEPLGTLAITLPSRAGRITFPEPGMVSAVDGAGQPVPFKFQKDGQTFRLTFERPIPPGQRLTIQLYPMRNPRIGGRYAFAFEAAPAGPSPRAQFIGFGEFILIEGGGK